MYEEGRKESEKMSIEELEIRIDALDDEVGALLAKFEKDWCGANFKRYNEGIKNAGGEKLVELKALMIQLRMTKEPTLSELSTYGSRMSLASFVDACEGGGFIDDDGFGKYVKDGQETDIEIYPSDVRSKNLRKDLTDIIWFNR